MADVKILEINGTEFNIKDEKARQDIEKANTQLSTIANEVNDLKGNQVTGSGLTVGQINALDNMFKVCAYDSTKDVASAYSAFKTAFGIEIGSGGETEEKTKYVITNNLTHITTDNSNTEIEEGSVYRATLTVETGYTVDYVVITMGDTDISASYQDGQIVINEVTGNIVITAIASQKNTSEPIYQLAEETTFDGEKTIDTGIALLAEETDFTIVTDFSHAGGGTYQGLFSIMEETDSKGYIDCSYSGWYWQGHYAKSSVNLATSSQTNRKIVITHKANEKSATFHVISNEGEKTSTTINSATGNLATSTNNLILGVADMGHFNGTIHDFKIYNRILTDDEINNYLGV